jgi:hypothetical protein
VISATTHLKELVMLNFTRCLNMKQTLHFNFNAV